MKRFGAISGLRARLLPMNKLRLVAPTNVLDAASRVTTALTTTALYTTDPLAQQVARKAAGEELGELHQRLPCGGRQGPVHRSFAPSCPTASSRSQRLSYPAERAGIWRRERECFRAGAPGSESQRENGQRLRGLLDHWFRDDRAGRSDVWHQR